MLRSVFLVFALALAAGAPAAAPASSPPASLVDYDARLPDEVVRLKRQPAPRITREDRRLVAQYVEATGASSPEAPEEAGTRGTVFVLPLGQGGGANSSARAQIAMLDATVDSLRRGTRVLGSGYTTGVVRTSTLSVERLSLVCATVVRRQQPEAGNLQLAERRCFHEVPGYLIGVTAVTAFRAPAEQAARETQLAFIMAIVRALIPAPRH